MKKHFFLMLGIGAMLASCSQQDELVLVDDSVHEVSFTVVKEGDDQSRAIEDDVRYTVAFYDEAGETEIVPEQVYTTKEFSVKLNTGNYACLIWADSKDGKNYDASDLKKVVYLDNTANDENHEAFYARQVITVQEAEPITLTLKRAVAQVNLKETNTFYDSKLKIAYNGYRNFDVNAQKASQEESITRQEFADMIMTSPSKPLKVVKSFYVLADSQRFLTEFTTQVSRKPEVVISNVPLQAGYQTNIIGHFGQTISQPFTASIDTNWSNTDYKF